MRKVFINIDHWFINFVKTNHDVFIPSGLKIEDRIKELKDESLILHQITTYCIMIRQPIYFGLVDDEARY